RSHHELAPFWIRYSKDCYFANRRMCVNDGFDFSRVNVFSAGDDHILQAIKNVEVSVCVLITNVARSEEAVSEREFSFFRLVPITAHDIRAASDQFTCLPGLDFLPCWIGNVHVDSEARSSARGELVLGVLVIQQASEKSGFAESVHLNKFNIWQNLPRAMNELGCHGRSTVSQMLEAR